MTREIIARIDQELRAGKGLVMATILMRIGSAPRSGGSRMLVFGDGNILGTIGGGSLEARVREAAGLVMVNNRALIKDFHFSGKDAAAMEMICGGSVQILIEWMDSGDQKLRGTIDQLASLALSKEKCWWVQAVAPDFRVEHYCFLADGKTTEVGNILPEQVLGVNQAAWVVTSQASYFVERFNQMGTVLIFGAGHVAQPVAHLCHLVDFGTVVVDDRPEYANQERFPDTDEILVSGFFEQIFLEREIDDTTYVVIVTRGHINDQAVLEHVLQTSAAYIGMIGSKRKWALLREDLIARGCSAEQIARVHTPIGLEIGAETPAEIAVSIVAELVKARADHLASRNSPGQS